MTAGSVRREKKATDCAPYEPKETDVLLGRSSLFSDMRHIEMLFKEGQVLAGKR